MTSLIRFVFAVFLILLAPLPAQSQNLPPEIEFDLKVQELASHIENERWEQALAAINGLKDGQFKLPPSFLHFEGKANLYAGNANAAEKAWIAYLQAEGKGGKYYTEALAGIVEAKQSPRYVALAEGEFFDCADCPVMVPLSPGKVEITNLGANDDQTLTLNIPYPFAIGKTEVTVGQFKKFARETGFRGQGDCLVHITKLAQHEHKFEKRSGRSWKNSYASTSDQHPVSCVSWYEAQAYVSWLSNKTGHSYRLPSEAEWTYAAKAGENMAYQCGDDFACLQQMAWTSSTARRNQPEPVGTKSANAWGLHDMTGNVWELMHECYDWPFKDVPTDGSLPDASGDCKRILKSGSWAQVPKYLIVDRRLSYAGDRWDSLTGFRVVRELR